MEYLGWFFFGLVIGILIGSVGAVLLLDLDRDIDIK